MKKTLDADTRDESRAPEDEWRRLARRCEERRGGHDFQMAPEDPSY